jgi:iron-sulfur cluster assembly accessory protein
MTSPNSSITISQSAAARIKALMHKNGKENSFFRIEVQGGGCQGFEYKFGVSDVTDSEDEVFCRDGAEVRIDRTSLMTMLGSEIDWVSSLAEEKFEIRNPHAVSSCGCGVSFSI